MPLTIQIALLVVAVLAATLGVLSFRGSSPRTHRPQHRRNPYAAPIGDAS